MVGGDKMINQELPNDPLKIKEIVRQNRRNGDKPARTGYKWTEEEIRSGIEAVLA